MTAQTAARKDRFGFPVQDCRRCGGSGQHSFNLMHGSVCFGCGGSGVQHTPKAAKAFAAYREACKVARRPVVGKVAAGDVITFDLTFEGAPRKGAEWLTVESVTVTPVRCGSSLSGTDEANRVYFYRYALTFSNGEVRVIAENTGCARKAVIDPAPFVAAAA